MKKEVNGVYCLANDKVLDWMIACLESLRVHAPDYRLVVIPFDDKIHEIAKLSHQYKFELFQDNSLKQLDEIGRIFYPRDYILAHTFRKLAVFWGLFDHFVFLDSDIVVLTNFEELFEAYFLSDSDFLYNDPNMEEVYKPGNFREKMIKDYSAKGFNTGFFLSSKSLLTFEEIKELLQEAARAKEFFVPWGEQPFLNYCIHTKQINAKAFADVVPDLCLWTWAKQEPVEMSGNVCRSMVPDSPDFGKRLPYIHWAGIECSPYMPNRKLFLHYRLKSYSRLSRLKYIANQFFKS